MMSKADCNIKNGKKSKVILVVVGILIIFAIAAVILYTPVIKILYYELGSKTTFNISLRSLSPGISKISAEQGNTFILEALVTDSASNPVPSARIDLWENSGQGTVKKLSGRTSKKGTLLIAYTPPDETTALQNADTRAIKIFVKIPGTETKASVGLELVRVPVVFVHGYKASPSIFANFQDYLEIEGFLTASAGYTSEKGVASGASELNSFLYKLSTELGKKGILTNRFDIIAHSMGGLVARYYTCSKSYCSKNNVSKIIFLSTPQAGSPFASLGLKYYNDRGIYDLVPDSDLYTKTFPSLINSGLNSNIRTASILGQYDEVVSIESASLEKWGIKTEIFNVGENNFTMEKLLSGKIVEAANHKLVLDNLKVYEKAKQLLLTGMPYPKRLY